MESLSNWQANDECWLELWSNHKLEFINLPLLQKKIGYQFKNPHLIYEALTHKSAVVDFRRNQANSNTTPLVLSWNERSEFLGDAVLSLVISTDLWHQNQRRYSEGDLSRRRSFLVKEKTLAMIAKEFDLPSCIILGKSEKKNGGKDRDALLADFLEALIGAVYLDSSYAKAREVIHTLYQKTLIDDAIDYSDDYKSKLQELYQDAYKSAPYYETLEAKGPDHDREFKVGVFMNEERLAYGWGRSKKQASQEAARHALSNMQKTEVATHEN